ncbi:hypothetical protein [Enterococcus mundtii]|uniref:Uncharacterized protein n=2 Tax=Enterococcus mundtii TaxID=53346 RepID=A0A1I4PEI5_ENTMU|nr:hypothetical protein [Enterococcus mundtii]OTP26894.1 hypothetical protein A5802_000628 [Enterococcus mundtii]SFM26191.1 hypothetical protein SAMN04487758_11622 [Enterococcus mundtii]
MKIKRLQNIVFLSLMFVGAFCLSYIIAFQLDYYLAITEILGIKGSNESNHGILFHYFDMWKIIWLLATTYITSFGTVYVISYLLIISYNKWQRTN